MQKPEDDYDYRPITPLELVLYIVIGLMGTFSFGYFGRTAFEAGTEFAGVPMQSGEWSMYIVGAALMLGLIVYARSFLRRK